MALRIKLKKEYELSDTGNADYFLDECGEDLRWHPQYHAWIQWNEKGGFWQTLDQLPYPLLINALRRRAHRELEKEEPNEVEIKWLLKSKNERHLRDCLNVAKTRTDYYVQVTDWNCDPDILAVTNGVVNLKTGKLRAHRREDFISMRCPHPYDPSAKCPRFRRFLKEVFADNAMTLTPWIQKAIGYSLTGQTSEHKFFLGEGDGRNGKSTLLNVISNLLGGPRTISKTSPAVTSDAELRAAQALPGYAYILAFHTLQKKKYGSAEGYALAALPGRRFVAVTEAEKGAHWNEAVLKRMTGGDAVQVRGIYSKPFEFVPQAKFWVAVNDLPETDDFSKAFWDRVCVIPFHRHFTVNPNLMGELLAELPGILAWAVRGATRWYAHGLGTNPIVQKATKKYRREIHPLTDFLREHVRRLKDPEGGEGLALKVLYARYEPWCDAARLSREERLGRKQFSAALRSGGFRRVQTLGPDQNETGFMGMEWR